MRLLFTIDTKDYDPGGRAFVRPSARALILREGKIAMVHSLKYDYYKFPGGGLETGEEPAAAMIRETREEAGLAVRPETVREYGYVRRIQKSGYPDADYLLQDNYYYLCDAEDSILSQRLDDYEADERFTLEFVAPEIAVQTNRTRDHGPKDPLMLEREARVLELLIAEGFFSYQKINAQTIDRWVDEGWTWGRPIDHETFTRARRGDWDVLLTPTKPVPHAWFGDLRGKKLLGLACGGGQQMPVFAALGADCTVLDLSEKQLASERAVAEREGYPIRIVCADMTEPLPFPDESFDLIFHPVSNCYAEDVRSIWKECARVLKRGGVLLSGTDHYVNYIVDEEERCVVNHMPFNPLRDGEQMRQLLSTDSGVQFSHSLSEQIGGQLEAGLTLTDLYEDTNGEGRLHELRIPTMLAMRSVKRS